MRSQLRGFPSGRHSHSEFPCPHFGGQCHRPYQSRSAEVVSPIPALRAVGEPVDTNVLTRPRPWPTEASRKEFRRRFYSRLTTSAWHLMTVLWIVSTTRANKKASVFACLRLNSKELLQR